jgi:DNA-binding response OmpR family regulator
MKQTIAIITEGSRFSKVVDPLIFNESQDVRVVICRSEEEVDEMLSTFNCQLVLLDGALKKMCCCKIIQCLSRKALFHFRIWFFPDSICKDYKLKLQALGVGRFICKSFDRGKLNREIASHLVSTTNGYSQQN